MYLSTIGRPESGTDTGELGTGESGGRRRWTAVGGNVVALGAVSLVTDVSAEMVTAILPLYLVVGLHFGPAAYGAVDGLYTGATALLRLVGGYVADRIHRRKAVAGVGYCISAFAKLGLLAAGGSATAIGMVITADRTGKGLRTAPRDALITLSTPPGALGRAFGVHRAMDSMGAFAGPLVALAVLAAAGQGFDAVFATSFCIAAMGVVILVLFVNDHHSGSPPVVSDNPPATAVSPRAALGLLRQSGVRRLLLAACLLGLATIGDGFVYLLLQRSENLAIGWFPLFAVGTSGVYLLSAAPLGALADRIGRVPMLLGGHAALITVYLLLFGPLSGWLLIGVTLVLYGVFYATTDGILMALAGPVLPEQLRTTGIALIQSGQALAYLASSVLFGAAWQIWGPSGASRMAAAAALIAMLATAILLAGRGSPHDTAEAAT